MARRKEPWGDAVGDVPWAAVLPPAPGDLRIVQAFVNTADLPTRTDELASLTGLQDWLKRWGRSFYDFSRIANGRWCVLRCGNLINSRIYRRRYPGHHWT